MTKRKLIATATLVAALFAALLFELADSAAASSIVQAIIPAAVPAANRQGTNGTKFFIAGTVAGVAANICTDADGNATTVGCSSNPGTVTSVDGSASNGVETIQGGSVAAITSAGTVRGAMPVRIVTAATDTILTTDRGKLVSFNRATAIAVTLPQSSSPNFPSAFYFCAGNIGAGTVTITPTTSTIDGAANVALTTNQGVCVFADGTNYFLMRGMGGATGSAGGALTGTYPNPLIANMANATCVPFNSSTPGILTQGAGGDGQPCNMFFTDTNPGTLTLRGNLTLHASLSGDAKINFRNTSNGIGGTGTVVYIVAGGTNQTALQCDSINIATSANQGICAIGAAPGSTALLNLVSINSPTFGAGADGLQALRAVSGAGSAVTGTGRNGGDITLSTGAGGNGTSVNGNAGNMNLSVAAAGAGAGSAGTNGNFIFNVAGSERFRLDALGHLRAPGTAPALTSCGSGPTISGSDTKGLVTVGTGATGCTITFNAAFTATPACTVTSQGAITFTYTVSTTAITAANAGIGDLSSTLLNYTCIQ